MASPCVPGAAEMQKYCEFIAREEYAEPYEFMTRRKMPAGAVLRSGPPARGTAPLYRRLRGEDGLVRGSPRRSR